MNASFLRLRWAVAAAALSWLAAPVASADPIGIDGDDCATCQGSILELLYDPTPVASNGTTTYRITLRIDTSGYEGEGTSIGNVAFKVSPQLENVTVIDAPGGADAWTGQLGGINANGCQSNANSGFACATAGAGATATVPGGTYEWVFDIEVDDPEALFTEVFQASVKVRYLDDAGAKVGDLTSENITLQVIPEPTAALLLGFGLAGLAARRRAS